MAIKNAVGRPTKFNMKTVDKLAFYIQRNYSVSDSCKFAKISRDTYYRYLRTEPLYADSIATARVRETENLDQIAYHQDFTIQAAERMATVLGTRCNIIENVPGNADASSLILATMVTDICHK